MQRPTLPRLSAHAPKGVSIRSLLPRLALSIALLAPPGCSIALRTEIEGDAGTSSESGADAFVVDAGDLSDISVVDASVADQALPDTSPPVRPGSCLSKGAFLFCDDFENGLGQWATKSGAGVTTTIQSLAVGPSGPSNVLAINVDGREEGYLSKRIAIPAASGQVEIGFRFRYDAFANVDNDLFFATFLTYSGGGGNDDGYSLYLERRPLNPATALRRFRSDDNNRRELSATVTAMVWYEVQVVVDKSNGKYATRLTSGGITEVVDQGDLKKGDQLQQIDLRLGYTGGDNDNKIATLFVDEVVVR